MMSLLLQAARHPKPISAKRMTWPRLARTHRSLDRADPGSGTESTVEFLCTNRLCLERGTHERGRNQNVPPEIGGPADRDRGCLGAPAGRFSGTGASGL